MSLSVNDLIEMISRGAQRCDWSTWRAAWGAHQRVAGEPRLHGWGLPSEKHGGVEMPGGRGAPGKVSQEHECMAVRSVTRRRHPRPGLGGGWAEGTEDRVGGGLCRRVSITECPQGG